MATFTGEGPIDNLILPVTASIAPTMANVGMGLTFTPTIATVNRSFVNDAIPFKVVNSKALYRGVVSGSVVYQVGSPPAGATNVVVVNSGESFY
jgi:hypothetical protein